MHEQFCVYFPECLQSACLVVCFMHMQKIHPFSSNNYSGVPNKRVVPNSHVGGQNSGEKISVQALINVQGEKFIPKIKRVGPNKRAGRKNSPQKISVQDPNNRVGVRGVCKNDKGLGSEYESRGGRLLVNNNCVSLQAPTRLQYLQTESISL